MMAYLQIKSHDNTVVIRSQAFCCNFPKTWTNQKVLVVILRALRSPETGKPLFTYQCLADAFGYPDRRNIHNYCQEFERCGGDLGDYLRRKRKVDPEVVAAVTAEVRQTPLVSEAVLCQRVSAHLGRADLTPTNIHVALEQVPCPVIRTPLRQQWEVGAFHPKEAVVLAEALAALMRSSSPEEQDVVARLEELGIIPAACREDGVVQRQQTAAVPALLNPSVPVSRIPERVRVMVLALTLYFWNVPLSRLGLWLGVSKGTVYQWPGGHLVCSDSGVADPGGAGEYHVCR
jgi:hypothetical protein